VIFRFGTFPVGWSRSAAGALGDSEPKYLNSPETPAYVKGEHLYGLDVAREAIRREGFAILVEGYLDLIALHQAGFENAVASLGTALTPSPGQAARALCRARRRQLRRGHAGVNAAAKSLDLFLERGFDVRVAEIPAGKDPDDFVRDEGAAAYDAIVRQAPSYLDFLVQRELRGRDLSRPEEKVAAINAILPKLARLESAVERAAWAGGWPTPCGSTTTSSCRSCATRSARRNRDPPPRRPPTSRPRRRGALVGCSGKRRARRSAPEVFEPSDLAGTRSERSSRPFSTSTAGLPVEGRSSSTPRRRGRPELLTRIAFRDEPPAGREVDGCLVTLRKPA
jgi:hypothetical protein